MEVMAVEILGGKLCLRSVTIDSDLADSYCEQLQRSTITKVEFSNCVISRVEDFLKIVQSLPESVKELSCTACSLNEESLQGILKKSKGIHKLELSYNPLFIKELVDFLPLAELQELLLESVGMLEEGLESLLTGLSKSKVERLSLAKNQLSLKALKMISTRLPDLRLKSLSLHHNDITNQGLSILGKGVQQSPLQELDLHFNWVDQDGLMAFLLQIQNTDLKRLNFLNNFIEPELIGSWEVIQKSKLESLKGVTSPALTALLSQNIQANSTVPRSAQSPNSSLHL